MNIHILINTRTHAHIYVYIYIYIYIWPHTSRSCAQIQPNGVSSFTSTQEPTRCAKSARKITFIIGILFIYIKLSRVLKHIKWVYLFIHCDQ